MNCCSLNDYRRRLVLSPELWQFELLSPQKLSQYSNDRHIRFFKSETIEQLWRIGLIRADLITSEREIIRPSLELVSVEGSGEHTYLDKRKLRARKKGYGGSFSKKQPIRKDIQLYFHPFRLYVLYHIERVFSANVNSTQYLLYPEGHITLSRHHVKHLDSWTSTRQFCDLFDKWNKTSEIAIVLEPASYRRVYGSIRWSYPETVKTIEAKLDKYKNVIAPLIQEMGVNQLEEFRHDLCTNAEQIDKNKLLHVLVRLTSWHQKKSLKDCLGCCMIFLSMAEIIRRSMEDATGQQFREEDELGFGQWMQGARKMLYGTDRVLDADQTVLREFLSGIGVDYGTKVRCYVEGETELGALKYAFEDLNGIEFVNLRGQFIEKKGKGLAFKGSLENDINSHVFSVVLLDGDRKDFVRVVKKAAQDEMIFGRFFISSPDFEFANFTLEELVDVIQGYSAKEEGQTIKNNEILNQVSGVSSAKDLFQIIARAYPSLQSLQKSEIWGEQLMAYALDKPNAPWVTGNEDDKERPIIQVARLILIGRISGYIKSRDQYRVDPHTGKLIER